MSSVARAGALVASRGATSAVFDNTACRTRRSARATERDIARAHDCGVWSERRRAACFEAIDATAKSRCGFYKTIYSIPRSIKPKFGSSACIVFAAGPSGELLEVFFSNCDGEG